MARISIFGSGLVWCLACSSDEALGASESQTAVRDPERREFAAPAELRGANGLRFDPEGMLFVSSVNDGKIYRLDPDSGEVLRTWGEDDGVRSPDDLTMDADGTLYVANITQGTVVAIPPKGHFRVLGNVGPGADGIALTPHGTLLVGRDFLGDGLYELALSGDEEPRTVNAEPGWINAMVFAADGTLYAPVWKERYIGTVDLDTGTVTQFSRKFEVTAASVRFDHHGTMHAVDGGAGQLYRVDGDTGELTSLLRYGLPLDNLAFDDNDRLFISSYADGSVHEVLEDGRLRVLKRGGLVSPVALAVARGDDESVYVGDSYGVVEYVARDGKRRDTFGRAIGLPGQRLTPRALRGLGDRLLALGTMAVETWDRQTGEVQSSWPVMGGVDAIEFQGHILVSRPEAGSIVEVSDDGSSDYVTDLPEPAGLAADDEDMFVALYASGEIRQLSEHGERLTEPRLIASDLDAPEGLVLLDDGDLAVVETGSGDVTRIARKTGKKTLLHATVSRGAVEGADRSLGALNALGVGADQLYVLSPLERTVYAIAL